MNGNNPSLFYCSTQDERENPRTLCDLKSGEKSRVRCLSKSQPCHLGKLSAMGITPGTEIEMLSNAQGPLLILVRSSRLCLCRSLAQAVMVE